MADVVDELTKIPDFMDKLGWKVAAALMRKWFSGPASTDRSKQVPDTGDIKIDSWVFRSEIAKQTYNQLVSDQVWANVKAQAELLERLRGSIAVATADIPFGDLSAPAPRVDRDYINFRVVPAGAASAPLNDVFGALGNFTYHVAVEGVLQPKGNRIILKKAGVYVFDSYDFTDDAGAWLSQPLGFWNFEKGQVSKFPGFGYHYITNGTFQEWRKRNGKGGDFWVYSDIKVIRLLPEPSFPIHR